MKKILLVATVLVGGLAISSAGINFSIGIGLPYHRPPVVIQPPVYYSPPVYVAPPFCPPRVVITYPPAYHYRQPAYGHPKHHYRGHDRHDRHDRYNRHDRGRYHRR